MTVNKSTLTEIFNACSLINEFIAGYSFNKFTKDIKTQSAVLHQLLIIGEAVKRLPAALKAKYPATPWKEISGMRDKLIHAYDEVDLELVWNTIKIDIPSLKTEVKNINKK